MRSNVLNDTNYCMRVLALILGILTIGATANAAVLYRLNPGGPTISSIDASMDWSADSQSSPSIYANTFASGNTVGVADAGLQPFHASVPAGVPTDLFLTNRYDQGGGAELIYSFPVANGSYEIDLLVAETWSGAQNPGTRVFAVNIEGVEVDPDVDNYARFGGYTPGGLKYTAIVQDGTLDIELIHQLQNPNICGIQISELDPAGYLDILPRTLNFGDLEVGSVSPPQMVTLVNLGQGGDPAITLNSLPADSSWTHNLVAQTIAPGDSVTFDMRFTPVSPGLKNTTLPFGHDGVNSPLNLDVQGNAFPVGAIPVSFGASTLGDAGGANPTVVQFGPDGRLYIGYQNGTIRIVTVVRTGPNDYDGTAVEVLSNIKDIPNRNDDGSLAPTINTRLMTGFVVTGTPTMPVIYASSSDSRISVGSDSGLDTNSGRITRLRWNGSIWEQMELVTGLPRSEENHGSNGLDIDEANQLLYLAQGGHTNMGAPSTSFGELPEYALSATILEIDLAQIGETPYELPTLDDPSRPNVGAGIDENDPFGGNDGANQAIIDPAGPVQIYSTGYRNQYDLVITQFGRMYTCDNGPNKGWGGTPLTCSNAYNEGNSNTYPDNLHYVSGPGYYAGHPNPTRGDSTNTFNGQSPIVTENPAECDYLIPGVTDGAIATFGTSTNGITEYTSSNFGGAMNGDLLLAKWDGSLERIQLNAAGDSTISHTSLISSVGFHPLDVTALGDNDPFPGTIWVAMHGEGGIRIYEPGDYDGATQNPCVGDYDAGKDEDGDGYSNADEIDNGTDPCSAADAPADFDSDFVSDLNDSDDDNDGILDINDAFARDAFNGQTTPLPIAYTWQEGTPGTGILGLGFTGLMANGASDYLNQFDTLNMTGGGAAGKTTIDVVPAGEALGLGGNLEYGLQFGVDVNSGSGPVLIGTQIDGSFFNGVLPVDGQRHGLQIGAGDQDHYLLISLAASGGQAGIELRMENAAGATILFEPFDWTTAGNVQLWWRVDPLSGEAQARVGLDNGAVSDLGAPFTLPAGPLLEAVGSQSALAVGLFATAGSGAGFTATWDRVEVYAEGDIPSASIVEVSHEGGDSAAPASFLVRNLSPTESIEQVLIDLSTTLVPGLYFDPNGTVGDDAGLCLTIDAGGVETGLLMPADACSSSFRVAGANGFGQLILEFTSFEPGDSLRFSVDIDPSNILPSVAPGPDSAGLIGAGELTGMTVQATIDDGKLHSGQLAPLATSAFQRLDSQTLPRPGLLIPSEGSSAFATPDSMFTVHLQAPSGSVIRLVDMEGELSLPAGGSAGAYDWNRLVALRDTVVSVESSGDIFVDWEIEDAGQSGGIHTLCAFVVGTDGASSLPSSPVLIDFLPPVLTDARGYAAITTGYDNPNGTTWYPDSIRFENRSPSGQKITKVRLDLSSSLYPDVLFDPAGTAGDVDGKCVEPSGGEVETGYISTADSCTVPFTVARDGGYEIMTLEFSDFDPGETFDMAIDIDPTSIQGATGVGGPGGVGGLELAGSRVTLWFDDGAVYSGSLFPTPESSLWESAVEISRPQHATPTLELLGVTTPGTVSDAAQTLRVTGTPGQTALVVLSEGELVIGGAFGPGYDIDPFEANNALNAQAFGGLLDGTGILDIPVTLSQTHGGAGIQHALAVVGGDSTAISLTSDPLVFLYDPGSSSSPNLIIEPSGLLEFAAIDVGDSATGIALLRHGGLAGTDPIQVQSLSLTGSNPGEFFLPAFSPTSLAPGDSLTLSIGFAPLFNGTRTAALNVNHNGSGSPSTLALSGAGQGGLPGVLSYRINTGGPSVAGWTGDTQASPAPEYIGMGNTNDTSCFSNSIDVSHASIPAATPASIFDCERWDQNSFTEMRYEFQTVPGPYRLRLHFADQYSGTQSIGARVFDVAVNDSTMLVDFDIFAEVGGFAGLTKEFTIEADTLVTLEFLHKIQNPLINGIELEPLTPELLAENSRLSSNCDPINEEICIDATYAVNWPEGVAPQWVTTKYFLDDPSNPANLLASFSDSLSSSVDVAHQFCFPIPTGGGTVYQVLDADSTLTELSEINNQATIQVGCSVTAVPNVSATRLFANVPNPFNPSTEIRFNLAKEGRCELLIYDPAGRLVERLHAGVLGVGEHRFRWDGRDRGGRSVSSGVYYYRLEAPGHGETRRMVLLK